jgi:hypothetical protein
MSLTVLLTIASFLTRIWLIEPLNPAIDPKGPAALPFAAIFAFGLSVVITLAVANCRRWRVVLWQNPGRLIGAFALAFVTPLAVFSWVPWITGGLVFSFARSVPSEPSAANVLFLLLAIQAALMAFWYPISCLIVSGIKSRWVRFALFCAMFWTAYSAIILTLGTQVFRL